MRASAAVGRGFRLRDRGDLQGALEQARIGLELLSKPYVQRNSPAEVSALISLTVLAEESAMPLHEQGASTVDLIDSINALKRLSGEDQPDVCLWLPFLEARLAAASLPAERTR